MTTNPKKCGFVAVIGAPNAGKSSLVNRIVGTKVSIVTHKVQTTRARIRGVSVIDDTQLVFIDTPGIFKPRRRLDRAMVAAAWEGLDGADATLLVIDAKAYDNTGQNAKPANKRAKDDTDAIINTIKARNGKLTLVVNKIDTLPRSALLKLVSDLDDHGIFEDVFLISALNGDGVEDLKAHLAAKAPEGVWMYPEDQLSDISDRIMAAEVTREKVYLRLHEELPYESTVETESWSRTKKNELRIEQTIYLARDAHKPIVLGKGGQTLKAIGAAAREELISLLGEPVHLFIHVKVREKWADEAARYREMGLDFVN